MPKAAEAIESELEQFLTCIDAITEHLRPARRPQDRNSPECSPREIQALTAIGAQNPITMTDLASAIGVTLSTATHTVDNLVKKGLVERSRHPQDRRIVQLKFSRKGARINDYVVKSRLATSGKLLGGFSGPERASFLKQLKQISERTS